MSFLFDSSRLISIGTTDRTIIQWQFFSESDSIALIDAKVSNQGPLGYAAPTDEALAARIANATMEELDMIETAQQVGAHLDTDSGDSDSDLSGGEIDSDIEKEKQASYDRTLYREDYQVTLTRSTRPIHLDNSFPAETEKDDEDEITARRETQRGAGSRPVDGIRLRVSDDRLVFAPRPAIV